MTYLAFVEPKVPAEGPYDAGDHHGIVPSAASARQSAARRQRTLASTDGLPQAAYAAVLVACAATWLLDEEANASAMN